MSRVEGFSGSLSDILYKCVGVYTINPYVIQYFRHLYQGEIARFLSLFCMIFSTGLSSYLIILPKRKLNKQN